MRIFALLSLSTLMALSSVGAGNPADEIRSFGTFNNVNPTQLAGGEILSERASMNFQDGISTQMCYVVMAPAAKVSNGLLGWDASSHENLGVFQHSNLHFPVRED